LLSSGSFDATGFTGDGAATSTGTGDDATGFTGDGALLPQAQVTMLQASQVTVLLLSQVMQASVMSEQIS
jgi:hypothetical protein